MFFRLKGRLSLWTVWYNVVCYKKNKQAHSHFSCGGGLWEKGYLLQPSSYTSLTYVLHTCTHTHTRGQETESSSLNLSRGVSTGIFSPPFQALLKLWCMMNTYFSSPESTRKKKGCLFSFSFNCCYDFALRLWILIFFPRPLFFSLLFCFR